MGDPGDMAIWRRIVYAYHRVHPSMLSDLEWRMDKTTFKLLLVSTECVGGLQLFDAGLEFLVGGLALGTDMTLFGMKIGITDTDEILLVMVV